MNGLFDVCFGKGCPEQSLVEVSIGGIDRSRRRWLSESDARKLFESIPEGDVYFAPAPRAQAIMGKRGVLGSWVCWVDVDRRPYPLPVLPPTAVVWSGNGWHIYWGLHEFCKDADGLEKANQALAGCVTADSAHNIDRLLRVPGSYNHKNDPPVLCKLRYTNAAITYSLDDIRALERMPPKIMRKITRGDRRGHRSRSERDWAIIRCLIDLGMTDPAIRLIFQNHACGDKHREDEHYLDHTIERARASSDGEAKDRITEKDSSYWVTGKQIQLSTFIIHPTLLLEGERDTILGDVSAQGTSYVWKDVPFPRAAFVGVSALSRHLDKACWGWLGKDADVRHLLPHLMGQLQANGVPRALATTVLGRHRIDGDDRAFFVIEGKVLASDGAVWRRSSDSPWVLLPTGRERPMVELHDDPPTREEAQQLADLLPAINREDNIWPLIGWFMASPLKPAIEEAGYRFPILNVCGTRGSGKTTTILRVFQPLLGYKEPRSYDVSTTQFVTLSLLGSTNAMPIAFSEFRVSRVATDFVRYVLLSYDTGHDARGRADQTTVDYPLIAPFTLDGEDKIDDPAALERMIVVMLSPQDIEEESEAWKSYQSLIQLDLTKFSLPYIKHSLRLDTAFLVEDSAKAVWKAFQWRLPDRIRRNLIVCWAGVLSMQHFLSGGWDVQLPVPAVEVLATVLSNVYSTALGRAPVAADAFIETIVNAAAHKTMAFPWKLSKGLLWFQLTPAYEYFMYRRTRSRMPSLTKDAVRGQLMELRSEYMEDPAIVTIGGATVYAYAVNLKTAHDRGLDVPSAFDNVSITLNA